MHEGILFIGEERGFASNGIVEFSHGKGDVLVQHTLLGVQSSDLIVDSGNQDFAIGFDERVHEED